ncbi:hypothetical protein ACMYR3_02345 [Ampullimonas aquatilis]|uniref:hypothetical protein n=1 Tax=Ampullimonas aquatilis TaxID=1341549 RepID=UPI003C76A757
MNPPLAGFFMWKRVEPLHTALQVLMAADSDDHLSGSDNTDVTAFAKKYTPYRYFLKANK